MPISHSILAMASPHLSPRAVRISVVFLAPLAQSHSIVAPSTIPPRPSQHWLNSRNPTWMGMSVLHLCRISANQISLQDGCQDPLLCFYTFKQMAETLHFYTPDHPALPKIEDVIWSRIHNPAARTQHHQDPTCHYCQELSNRQDGSYSGQDHQTNESQEVSSSAPTASTPSKSRLLKTLLVCSFPSDLAVVGHKTNVTMQYSLPPAISSISQSGKLPAAKKTSASKLAFSVLKNLDRAGFIVEYLKSHDLTKEYSPGVTMGPPFKLWWTSRYVYVILCLFST